MEDLDIRWDNYSHREIVDLVNAGPGASLTATMEAHLRRVSDVLDELADQVSGVIARTGGDWQGGAADVATNAMSVLRGVDDGMHFTSNLAGIRVFGQSDNAGWVRANMPPVVEVHPPEPTGQLIDILNASIDYQKQRAAARQAEQRAREIMQQYTEATRERAAGMTPLSPVPQVVLDVTSDPAKPPSDGGRPPQRRDPVDGQDDPGTNGRPDEGPSQQGRPSESTSPGSAGPIPTAPVPPSTQSAATPGGSALPVTSAEPVRTPSGSGSPLPLGGGLADGAPGGHSETRPPGRESLDRRGGPLLERGPAGVARESAGRGAAPIRGGVSRPGGESPFVAGPASRREEDRDHQVKYGLPSAEHFEPADPDLDPHREGWHVAPDVIGDLDDDV